MLFGAVLLSSSRILTLANECKQKRTHKKDAEFLWRLLVCIMEAADVCIRSLLRGTLLVTCDRLPSVSEK